MRERVHRMGGTLEISSANSRTIVRAMIPVRRNDRALNPPVTAA
jgi:signal transduction histidine kinase